MSDLWLTASADHEAEAETRLMTTAMIAVAPVWTHLARAESHEDYLNRKALHVERIEASLAPLVVEPAEIAALSAKVMAQFDGDFEMIHEAKLKAQAAEEPAPPEPVTGPATMKRHIHTQTQPASDNGSALPSTQKLFDSLPPSNKFRPQSNADEESKLQHTEPDWLHPHQSSKTGSLQATATDIEEGLAEGDYTIDAFGAVTAATKPHPMDPTYIRESSPMPEPHTSEALMDHLREDHSYGSDLEDHLAGPFKNRPYSVTPRQLHYTDHESGEDGAYWHEQHPWPKEFASDHHHTSSKSSTITDDHTRSQGSLHTRIDETEDGLYAWAVARPADGFEDGMQVLASGEALSAEAADRAAIAVGRSLQVEAGYVIDYAEEHGYPKREVETETTDWPPEKTQEARDRVEKAKVEQARQRAQASQAPPPFDLKAEAATDPQPDPQPEGESRIARFWRTITGAQGPKNAVEPCPICSEMIPLSKMAGHFREKHPHQMDLLPHHGAKTAEANPFAEGSNPFGAANPVKPDGTTPGAGQDPLKAANPVVTPESSPPRTKPADNPAFKPPAQPVMPMMPGAMPMGQPHQAPRPVQQGFAMKVAQVADGILNANPGMEEPLALHLATLTVQKYPAMVKEAVDSPSDMTNACKHGNHAVCKGYDCDCHCHGGTMHDAARSDPEDYDDARSEARKDARDEASYQGESDYGPDDDDGHRPHHGSQHEARGGVDLMADEEGLIDCPQCHKPMFSPLVHHCHACGYVDLTGRVGGGWDPLAGPHPQPAKKPLLQNPGVNYA